MKPALRTLHRYRPAVGLCLLSAALSACTLGPDFMAPPAPQLNAYTSTPLPPATVAAQGQPQLFSADHQLPADWWHLFHSAQLDATVQQALTHNPTLQSAYANLRQSQHLLQAGDSVFFPWLSAGASAERARSAPLLTGSHAASGIFNVVSASVSVSYPLDLFGAQRRTVESLAAQADQQRWLARAAYLSLSANVVNTCIAQAAYTAELKHTAQLIALAQEQLNSIEAQARSGSQAYANVLSQRSLIASRQAELALLTQKRDQAGHLLAALEGGFPAATATPPIELDTLQLPLDLPLSLPSELVKQRPDILVAQAQLHVASANIGIATAAMLPSLSLSASYGAAGSSAAGLLGNAQPYWSAGPSLTAPLFQAGSLHYKRNAALDAYDAQMASYQQTVLSAFAQVADALQALLHDAEVLQAQTLARDAAARALQLAQANYRAGIIAYVDMLTADAQFHTASISYIEAQGQRLQDTVALFAALGGGWWNGSADIPADIPQVQEGTP